VDVLAGAASGIRVMTIADEMRAKLRPGWKLGADEMPPEGANILIACWGGKRWHLIAAAFSDENRRIVDREAWHPLPNPNREAKP